MKKIIFFFLVFTFSSLSCTVVDTELFELVLEIKNQNQELLEEVKALQAKSDSLINELKNSAAKQEEVLKKVTDLQAELVKVLAQIGTLNEQLGAQNADLDEIKSQLADLEEKYKGILVQLEQLQKLSQILAEIEKLKGQLSELDGKYQVILGSLAQNKEQLDALKGQIATLQSQLAENLTKISQLTSQLGEQGADIEKILAAIEELKKSCAEIKAILENQLSGKSPVPTNGLAGWWPFNGNANDESGNENNGTAFGAKLSSDRFGFTNKAFEFDGVDDFISVPNSQSLNITGSEITISMWVLQQNNDNDNLHKGISKGGWDLGNGYELLYRNTNTNDSGALQLSGANGGLQQFFDVNGNYGKWINITGVFQNGNGVFYVNGDLIEANFNGSKFTTFKSNQYPLLFGKRTSGQQISGFVKGKLDDIAIWDRALTPDEISKIYKGEGF
jgi:uncharacterized coiled-coil DUF342 family protein